MKYAIVLAGGIGSRFWPLSKKSGPKQFLRCFSKNSLLGVTLGRVIPFFGKKNIFLAANIRHSGKIKKILSGRCSLPAENYFFEPEGKNTLPPVAVLSARILRQDKEAVIAVLPSDHYIGSNREFLSTLSKAVKAAAKGYIVTLGIKPARPETGYGYIKIKLGGKRPGVYPVADFIEKPPLAQAKKYCRTEGYFWNSGVFIFRADVFLRELKKYAPALYSLALEIAPAVKINPRLWKEMPSQSIDYGIMEKTRQAALCPADYAWSDLGSWSSFYDIFKGDKNGNIISGNCLDIESRGSIIWSDGRLLATLGLKDIVAVSTKDAVLVCSKERCQEVKRLVRMINGSR